MSDDGRFVAFESGADNLVPGDTNGVKDIFVKDLEFGFVVRASTGANGSEGNEVSEAAGLSGDGLKSVSEATLRAWWKGIQRCLRYTLEGSIGGLRRGRDAHGQRYCRHPGQ